FGPDTITDIKGEEFLLDDTARRWLINGTDARAIRNRGTVLAELVKGFIEDKNCPDLRPKWMSVACGTALPSMKAAIHAGITPDLALVDISQTAMAATEELAAEIGYTGSITKHFKNIFKSKDMAELRDFLGSNGDRPQIIDLMGIFEYVGKHIRANPVNFLRANYDMLRPGGQLIFGQMRDDRPCQDFTMGVIGWPFIVMRSPKQVLEIVDKAGIPTISAKLYLPEDGVYTICSIQKPDGHEQFAS
ncbi:MAG: hypothetical protein ACREGF_07450, partial [Candidatus Saccharimonadales bacterium]